MQEKNTPPPLQKKTIYKSYGYGYQYSLHLYRMGHRFFLKIPMEVRHLYEFEPGSITILGQSSSPFVTKHHQAA